MLAAVTDDSGLVAVHRTFLDRKGRRARDLQHPRRLLGHPRTGAVRLAPATDTLGIAEGIETAISAMILRSEEHTSELQSLMRISYAVFCLKKKKKTATI